MRKYLYLIILCVAFAGCKGSQQKGHTAESNGKESVANSDGKPAVTVTIPPYKFFVDKIAGDKVDVNVMVSNGNNPETYEPYAQQMMDQYGDTYTANGIGLETIKAYERLQVEHTALLDMVYGPDGETPVEDDELTSHLDDSMYEICYISIPLYNTSTYAFANDDQKAEMLKLAQTAADSVNAAGGETVSDQVSALHEAAQNALPDIYAVLDGETSDDSASVQTELLTESDVASTFTQDGAADALRSLSYGEAAAVQINGYTLLLLVRVDPLSVSSLDDLREQVLSDMKGSELDDALASSGAELAHSLNSSAMNKLPAKKIVNSSANS